ncbi:MAG: membrane protein insertase YidC, partial [Caulobacteraceae bacterium]|nr:membrane protein insertase YidC [Caulobacteraceae bacterium]
AAAASAAQHPAASAATGGPSFATRAQALAAAPRVPVDTPSLSGSISLRGARIDDLNLKHYRVQPAPNAPQVELLRPAGAEHAWFAQMGWYAANVPGLPDDNTVWTQASGGRLTPATPVVLTYDNGQGLKFTRTIALDADYMFTVSDTVANATAQPITLQSFGVVEQQGLPKDLANNNIVHEGAIGVLDNKDSKAKTLTQSKYKDWKKKGFEDRASVGGWVGVTEKYWLTALIPDQAMPITAKFPITTEGGVDVYHAGYFGPAETVAPGASLTHSTRLFAGAKTVPLLRTYQYSGHPPAPLSALFGAPASARTDVPSFDKAVDWGMFWFFTRPLFLLLETLKGLIGNIGLSILALTVIVKLVFFPLANKSYESMSKMKKIQPQIELLRKQNEQDPAKLQQETMALYQREKINPFMGCLPMLIQIPVFYSLYKVLTVTIEMRQTPFFGWIHDLASRDPTTVWNLFGLLPFDPSHLTLVGPLLDGQLHLGAWPLIYGFTMWLSQAMSPPAGVDPTQRMMFQLMPIMFTFFMAQFTVGLLIYWSWNNFLSILQQYVIMHRLKVDNPIDTFLGRFSKAGPAG